MNSVQASLITQMVASRALSGGSTVTANQDCKGYDYCSIIVNLAAQTTASMTALPVVSLLESDDTTASNFATYVADKGTIASIARDYVYHIDMRGRKRYQRISVTAVAAGTDGSTVVGVASILTKAELAPANTSAMVGGGTNDICVVN